MMKPLLFLSSIFLLAASLFANGPVLKTEQTKCYNTATDDETSCTNTFGQDGNYQKGLDRSYFRLALGDLATVDDISTGLTWKDDVTVFDGNWTQAIAYCEAFDGDWRLPTIQELGSIVHYGKETGKTIDETVFQNTGSGSGSVLGYWSVTEKSSNDIRTIDFNDAHSSWKNKSDISYTRCVSGTPFAVSSYSRNSALETVYDSSTNLTWQDNSDVNDSNNVMEWDGGMYYCRDLEFAGKNDWRLPNINELTMIVDYTQEAPTIDKRAFKNTSSSYYWSSTTSYNTDITYNAWSVYFNLGYNYPTYKEDDFGYVRCVRDGKIETSAFTGTPAYDSKWIAINPGEVKVITHNLGQSINDYVVNLTAQGSTGGVERYCYGGCDKGDSRKGFFWYGLNENNITVKVREEDDITKKIRVQIWRDPNPDFDSGWVPINQGDDTLFVHNTGGHVDDYIVDLQFSILPGLFPHQMYYGGIRFGAWESGGSVNGQLWGAYWHSLTNTTVNISRMQDDLSLLFFRGRIWNKPKPDFDSDWGTLGQGLTSTLPVPLDLENNFIYYEQRYGTWPGYGINHIYYGGFENTSEEGSYWSNAHNNAIDVYRFDEDSMAAQARFRVYETKQVSINAALIMYLLD